MLRDQLVLSLRWGLNHKSQKFVLYLNCCITHNGAMAEYIQVLALEAVEGRGRGEDGGGGRLNSCCLGLILGGSY